MAIQRRGAILVVLALIAVGLVGSALAEPVAAEQNATEGALTLSRGADPLNVVMDAEEGPVAFCLAKNDRLIACQYAPGRTPYDKNRRSKAFILFDLKSGREIQRTPFQIDFYGNFWACSDDGRYLVLGGRDKTYQLDLEKGSIVRTWTLKEAFGLPAISPDGTTLALGDN